jgi:hypothetical protein
LQGITLLSTQVLSSEIVNINIYIIYNYLTFFCLKILTLKKNII